MGHRRWLVAAPGVILSLASCATVEQQDWYQKAHDSSAKAVDVVSQQTSKAVTVASDQAAKALVRMQHYLAEKDLLKTFHDAGEHSEASVLAVLHKAGVSGAKGAAPAPSPPSGAKPPKAPPPAAPPPGAAPPGAAPPAAETPSAAAPTGPLPDHYAGKLRRPIDAGIVSSEFGERWGKMHKGIDIAAEVGEPLYAIAPGEVIYAGNGLRGYGNVAILRHDRQRTSLYAHTSELKVQKGDMVAQGALVALVGNTGHSTGPHVHFEIRDGDVPVNPRSVLPPLQLAELLEDPDDLAAPHGSAEPPRLAASR
ncbi:MAG TPA: M23 family metallopeptidase [Steroidobacteraceae bacterium]|nr:M23 family metallopeptidase [Steroidobacteraceae bacterium]